MEEGTHMGSTPRLGEEDDLAYHDNVEEASIWPASLHPPPLPAAAPPWILLELPAYLTTLGGAAATTARSRTRGGHAIEATLFPAAPPLLYHIRVHCPDLSPTRFAAEPRVYAAADGLILFAVAIGHRFLSSNLRMLDYFLYDLARPSLELLPHPPEPPGLRPHPFSQAGFFGDKLVALLRLCHNDEEQLIMRPHGPVRSDYIIAILVGQEGRAFDLHRYRSDAGAWTRTRLQLAASVNTPLGGTFFSHYTDKVITLTGGFVGWADLRRGAILFLDVLLDDPQPHYVPLPPQPMTGNCDALVAQDIAVVDKGYIKFIDHRYNDDASDHGWTATTWTKKIAADPWKEEEGW
ncbi:uncharacterized protein LOC104584013 [Brachypodium distachyon]|uniref:DUF1618 domain-containing protein n=1 Tax=Brachypodium distachyon TaxID=15368 RepID=A0A0Q3I2Q8_BRADI|nr:uncharacterized protein LOC104584013 [Brachypodium distachyon]KQJ94819.1 hypothetical protein BRADI_3g13431v3 [Brachypodium distachyon]|eukprot:XP_010236399.2 uncharacterized protein LOC104584013 [Brachypodium distachyon]